jgi:tetratricopeptide (TPR) repeat protein
VSENHRKAAHLTHHDKNDAQTERVAPLPTAEFVRDTTRQQRIQAVHDEVADAAALRSKMIEAMRRRLESEAASQSGRSDSESNEPQAGEKFDLVAREVSGTKRGTPRSEIAPAKYPMARRPPDNAHIAANDLDSIFAPEPTPVPRRPVGTSLPPQFIMGGNPAIWDEAFQSAQRVENALAKLREALARDENRDRRRRAARAKGGRRPGLLRVATLFMASFLIGSSALIFLYDSRARISIEDQLSDFIGELWTRKTATATMNSLPLAGAEPAEKPLAVAAVDGRSKKMSTVKLEAFDAQGTSDAGIPLSIQALGALPDQRIDLRLWGLPPDAKLSSGRRQSDGSWLLKPKEQSGLKLHVTSETSGFLKLTVEAWEHQTGELAAPPQEIKVTIVPGKVAAEPRASPIVPVANIRRDQALAVSEDPPPPEPPNQEIELAAIEEAAETPAMAVGIDDPSLPLLARGDALMELGDVISARSFYDRAFELGNARAARSIARTYDPVVLASMNVHGLRADPAKALDWYRKAEKAGETDATQAIAALETFLGQ